MKRDISCTECIPMWREIAADDDVVGAGETVRIVEGLATKEMLCDACSAQIADGQPAAAVSVLARGQADMPGWEAEYVRSHSA